LEQAEQEDARNVEPVGPCQAQQPAIQGEIGVVHDNRSALLALLKGTPGSFRARTGCDCVTFSGCVGLYTSSVRGEASPSRAARSGSSARRTAAVAAPHSCTVCRASTRTTAPRAAATPHAEARAARMDRVTYTSVMASPLAEQRDHVR